MFTVIPAQFEDLPAILALQKLSYSENAVRYNNFSILPMVQNQIEIESEFAHCIFFKAIDESSSIIGSIRAFSKENSCFIIRLFVHPDHQNKGVGKMLMQAAEKHFASSERYELFTGFKDTKNLSFYASLGYRILREETRHDGMRFIFMEKRVPPIQ